MNESDSIDNNKGSNQNELKADETIKFDTRDGQNDAYRNEVSVHPELGYEGKREKRIPSQEEVEQMKREREERKREKHRERQRRYLERKRNGIMASQVQKPYSNILDKEERRKALARDRRQRYVEKKRKSTITSQVQKPDSNILDKEERKREKHRERQRRYLERKRNGVMASQVQKPYSNILEKKERRKALARDRQRRYVEKKRESTITSQVQKPGSNTFDKEERRKALEAERQRRFQNKCRQQEEFRQRIRAEQNASVLQVQSTQEFENVKTEYSEETAIVQYPENSTIFIKQECEDENAFVIPESSASMNNDSSAMEITQENPLPTEIVKHEEIIHVKEENIEAPSPTTRQNFFFVSCADSIALNDATINDSRMPCPYCGKIVQQQYVHERVCDAKFVYFCMFCPTVIRRPCNIKRHIRNKHSNEINSASQHLNTVDKIFQEIVAKRKELNISTPEERDQAIRELQNANETEKLEVVQKEICIVTKNQQELIIPDSIETHQELTADTQTSNTPVVVLNDGVTFGIPATVQILNIVQNHSVSTEMTKEKNVRNLKNTGVAISQESNVPFTVIHENMNPVFVNVSNQGVVFQKKAKIKKSHHVYCNECVYKSTKKTCLQNHITKYHGDELNLNRHRCNRCRKSFQYKDHWKAHKAICKVKAYYYCLFCPKSLMFSRMLRHVQLKHPKEIENKTTDEIDDLLLVKKEAVESLAVNNQEAVADTQSAYFHNQQYSDETPIKDNLACHVNGTRSAQLNRQSRFSKPKKANIRKRNYLYCHECNYKIGTKALLLKHITKYHGDKLNMNSHNSIRCEKNSPYKGHLMTHMQKNLLTCMENVYYCPFCLKYMLYHEILTHVQSQHPKEIENKNTDEIKNLLVAKKEAVEKITVNVPSQHPKNIENIESDQSNNSPVATKRAVKSLPVNKKDAIKVKPKTRPKSKSTVFRYCDHCDYKTSKKYHLIRHIGRTHSAQLNIKFENCKRKKSIKKKVNNESRIRIRMITYTCIFCPTSYTCLKSVKIHTLQKHSSELAEKSIEDITKQVDAKKTISYRIQTSKQAKIKHPEIDPYEIDASTIKYVPVYCCKCKHVKTSFSKAGSRLKNCQDCGTQMIYVCSKCKEMHTMQFNLLVNHWKQCAVNDKISQFNLDKLELYSCSDCLYVCTHKYKMESHIVRFKHKAAGMENAEGSAEETKNNQISDEGMDIYDEAKFAIRPCVTDYLTMTRRYCSKCDKVVTEDMQKRKTPTNESCQVCGTRFHFQCVKCNLNYKSYLSVRYHLNSKCFPGDYKCIKCDRHSRNWHLMQKHYLNSHTNRKEALLCEFCSFRTKHRTNFYTHMKTIHPEQSKNVVPDNIQLKRRDIDFFCDKCNFTTKRKGCIKVHLQNVHGTKRHKCKICKFKTRYEASLKRHYTIRHQNYY